MRYLPYVVPFLLFAAVTLLAIGCGGDDSETDLSEAHTAQEGLYLLATLVGTTISRKAVSGRD